MSQFISINRNQNQSKHKFYASTYADLNLLSPKIGDIAYVYTTTGTGIFQTKRLKGAYDWDGTSWEYSSDAIQYEIASNIAKIQSNDQDILALQQGKLDKGTYPSDAQSIFDAIPDVSVLLPTGNYIGTAETLKNDIDRLTWSAFIKSELPLMNQRSRTFGYEPYFVRESIVNVDNTGTWKLLLPYDGDYEIELDYRFSLNTTTTNFEAHILLDGNTFTMPLHIEPKDSAGAGQLVPTVVDDVVQNTSVNTGTDQFIKASGKRFVNRNAGDEIDLRLEFAGQSNDQEATIYNASIIVRYIENKNVFTVPPSIGTATYSDTPFFGGFNASITINNTSGSAITSWTVIISGTNWDVTSDFGQSVVTDLGNGNWQFDNVAFNGSIADGGSIQFGFQGTTGNAGGVQSPTNGQITVSGS